MHNVDLRVHIFQLFMVCALMQPWELNRIHFQATTHMTTTQECVVDLCVHIFFHKFHNTLMDSSVCMISASRAKLSAVKSISKLRGQANILLYPQPEGQLGECMLKFGKEMGDDSLFGRLVIQIGWWYRLDGEGRVSFFLIL